MQEGATTISIVIIIKLLTKSNRPEVRTRISKIHKNFRICQNKIRDKQCGLSGKLLVLIYEALGVGRKKTQNHLKAFLIFILGPHLRV